MCCKFLILTELYIIYYEVFILHQNTNNFHSVGIDSISGDERGLPLTEYITNGGILALGTISRILNTAIVFFNKDTTFGAPTTASSGHDSLSSR